MAFPKFLEDLVILCFKREYLKQNTVARLKSKHFDPTKILDWPCHSARK